MYQVLKFLPYWAIPLAILAGEQAFVYMRRGRKPMAFGWGAVGVALVTLAVLHLIYDGERIAFSWIHGRMGTSQ